MEQGDFLFFYPKTFFDRRIAEFSGKYCHVGIYLGRDLMISSRWFKGVGIDRLSVYDKEYDVFSIKGLSYQEAERIITFLMAQMGKKYDKKQVFFVPFNKLFSHPGKYFCSELAACACILIGRIPDKEPERLSPTDLANQSFLVMRKKKR